MKNALKKYRKAEEEDVDAAIADFEEGVEHEGYDNDAHLTDGGTPIHGTCSQSQLRV